MIGKLNIDFPAFLIAANKGLNKSLTRGLDSQGKDTKSIAAYLVMLAEMRQDNVDPNKVLQDAGQLLKHAYYVFQVIVDHETMFDLLELNTLAVHNAECINSVYLSVVSGTLEDWRTAIINGCSDQATFNIRLLFDKILLMFEKEGLSKLWVNYSKRKLPDDTFRLLENK